MRFAITPSDAARVSTFVPTSAKVHVEPANPYENWVSVYIRGTENDRPSGVLVLPNMLCTAGETAKVIRLGADFDSDPDRAWEELVSDLHLRTRQGVASHTRAVAERSLFGARLIGDQTEAAAWEAVIKALGAVAAAVEGKFTITLGETDDPVGTDGLTDRERWFLARQAEDEHSPTADQRSAVKAWANGRRLEGEG